ncbi:MAG: TatD family hydrolase [bacterium]
MYRTAGLHPWAAAERGDRLAADLQALAETLDAPPRPVALGELGLDHLACPRETRGVQEAAFRAQLALARERDLPVVLHIVRAHGRALEILRADGLPAAGGVVHGFSGSADVARDYARLGLYLGIGFVALRPGARKLHGAIAALPADRLLLETDAPAEPPPGVEGASEPAHLLAIAEAVAALKGLEARALLATSTAGIRRLYRLPAPRLDFSAQCV